MPPARAAARLEHAACNEAQCAANDHLLAHADAARRDAGRARSCRCARHAAWDGVLSGAQVARAATARCPRASLRRRDSPHRQARRAAPSARAFACSPLRQREPSVPGLRTGRRPAARWGCARGVRLLWTRTALRDAARATPQALSAGGHGGRDVPSLSAGASVRAAPHAAAAECAAGGSARAPCCCAGAAGRVPDGVRAQLL
jgi:hypothetical protein